MYKRQTHDVLTQLPNRGLFFDRVTQSLELAKRRGGRAAPVSYTHLRAHETVLDLVCRLLLEKKKKKKRDMI